MILHNGTNYDMWSQIIEMHIDKKEKFSLFAYRKMMDMRALSKAFYDGTYELQVLALNKKDFSPIQRCITIFAYYGELTKKFSELDHHDKVIMESDKDVETY
ncbi:hypothetical protein SADUNF_Sadunf16G0222100 [Salix dunnii]|uniref:Retrotransposon Copia-like N-terminal domain-containing protein n=1 Tax=Salix dunnii TaxID=1413687 RepID=A0A835MH76_9ROSI|nr:hypothetical protein SADUNF_Sadunf16G0222100 [Salix dunnii]